MLTTTIGQFIILLKDKVKGKVVADNKASRREGLKGVEEQLHAFLTSALDSG
jgi:ABC-type oligopeptide transport system ATPase subunit